jgi:fructose/tagatose bisphosphate aldolase
MLLSGDELRKIFRLMCPFAENGELLPEPARRTVLAANANMPMEIFGRAMVMAAAEGLGSPIIVQVSYNALLAMGNGGAGPGTRDALVLGARIASFLLEEFAGHHGADCVALSLDHFKVPPFGHAKPGSTASKRVQRARLLDAMDALADVLPGARQLGKDVLDAYLDYLCSDEYAAFKRDFLSVVSAISPAWGMIDTEHLPPLLDFAVTKEISDGVRNEVGDTGMMLEAEYGATGQSGTDVPYKRLDGEELGSFAAQVCAFVSYTAADGIAYPIGMEHAARTGETHEPDALRLRRVQGKLFLHTGRYVPFAQHGGTGAAHLERGLVGKNNVNTRFLAAGAGSLLNWMDGHRQGIEAGEKSACGHEMYVEAVRQINMECLTKLKEAGTYGMAPECIEAILTEEEL